MQYLDRKAFNKKYKYLEIGCFKCNENSNISRVYRFLRNLPDMLDIVLFYLPIYFPKVLISKKDDTFFYVRIKKEDIWSNHMGELGIDGRNTIAELLKINQFQQLVNKYQINDDVTIKKTKYFSFLVRISDIPSDKSTQEYCEVMATKYVLSQLFPDIPQK